MLTGNTLRYVPQLDSVRAIAALMVVGFHLFPRNNVLKHLPLDQMGVNIFFVLSGYLISRILVNQKVRAENEGGSKRRVFRQFVIRRALRIFPIYYLYILLLLLTPKIAGPVFREQVGFHLAYLSNFLFYRQQAFDSVVPHFWTLALEEQFYVFWPSLLLLTATSRLRKLIVGVTVAGVVGHLVLIHIADSLSGPLLISLLPPTVFYAFGLGGLLAWYELLGEDEMASFGRTLAILFFIQLPFFLYFHIWHLPDLAMRHPYIVESGRLCVSIQAAYAIYLITRRKLPAWLMATLDWRCLRYLGRISYGLYLYHLLVPMYYRQLHALAVEGNWRIPLVNVLVFPDVLPAYLLATFAVAALSWHAIEQPLGRVKDRLQYGAP